VVTIPTNDPVAVAAVDAIHAGDLDALRRLLVEHPSLALARFGGDVDGVGDAGMSRTLLHVVTDWPGHFPNGAATVAMLVGAGADVDAPFVGPHRETPLHWAASSDDVEVLDALLDAAADIEAPGAVIGGGTPLADAVAFGQWRAARLLVERGARTTSWQAAALGLMGHLEDAFGAAILPPQEEITHAFWSACHGGQRQTAEYLLARGADLDWIGYDGLTPLDAARRHGADGLVGWLRGRGAHSAGELG
jgi:hypothetical protein